MNVKNILAGGSFFLVIACLVLTSQLDNLESREGLLISIILALGSAAFSWVISSHYSKKTLKAENTKLIDRIGEQSSEKILNQSKQLYSIEQYLDSKQEKSAMENSDSKGMIYLESTRNMIRLIRSSNNTYLSDWAGVVSDEVREKLTEQSNAQSQLFEDIDLISSASPAKREKIEEKIEANSQKLPSHLVPQSSLKRNNAELHDHLIETNDTDKKKGIIKVLLSEPSFKGHVVAKFDTNLSSPPTKNKSVLKKSPNGSQNVNVFAKTGTVYDFHIGLKSDEFNVPLQPGIYEIEYEFEVEK
ncbi:hypothetical protein C900_00853 [Fulvivirga imtechensis AK7]|uniref:Uncharacterized protein n=1 Tax=Fulvivirga imtechensis AK7 TaxID=1237149 RepID=L8K092_9BACT|nr:hypothetical protein [Fulvivirga imtechensis]ELR72892.1 hypothetical protein C900_00853 [Fulvivirga imtechensis AK7]